MKPAENPMGERIRIAVMSAGGPAEVGTRLGQHPRLIERYFDRAEPSLQQAAELAVACDVTLEWLAYGAGEMRQSNTVKAHELNGIIRMFRAGLPKPETLRAGIDLTEFHGGSLGAVPLSHLGISSDPTEHRAGAQRVGDALRALIDARMDSVA